MRIRILIVILVVILLIIFLYPRLPIILDGPISEKSKCDLAKIWMSPIETAINAYKLHIGEYPKTLNDLLKFPRGLEGKWEGPYIHEQQLMDPWGFEYIYEPNSVNPAGYKLISYGRDGKTGGEGYNADIHN
jgi:general secretion pathway protein G